MARLLGPDPTTRMAIRPGVGGRRLVEAVPGRIVKIFTDETFTTPANIAEYQPGSPNTPGPQIQGSELRISADARIPLFWFPDGADTVWARTRNGYGFVLVADVGSRLNALVLSAGAVSSVAGRAGDVTLAVDDIGGLDTALDGKADDGHGHTIGDVTGLQDALDDAASGGGGGGAVTSVAGRDGDVVLAIADVTGLQGSLDGKADDNHGHAIANVTGLQGALDGKADDNHSHMIAEVVGLGLALDDKADAEHSHAIADVTGLQGALDGKADDGHGHTVADVTGLQGALDGKADNGHGHTVADVTGLQGDLDDLDGRITVVEGMTPVMLVWNGSAYAESSTARVYVGPNDPGSIPDGSVWIDTTP